jgi:hypothetical protein
MKVNMENVVVPFWAKFAVLFEDCSFVFFGSKRGTAESVSNHWNAKGWKNEVKPVNQDESVK